MNVIIKIAMNSPAIIAKLWFIERYRKLDGENINLPISSQNNVKIMFITKGTNNTTYLFFISLLEHKAIEANAPEYKK